MPEDAPLLLVGGGAQGAAWRDAVLRLSGRAVQVPAATELVALGAAIQAASLLTGADPGDVARAWGTADGEQLDPQPRDDEALARFAAARDAAIAAAG